MKVHSFLFLSEKFWLRGFMEKKNNNYATLILKIKQKNNNTAPEFKISYAKV